MYHTCLAQQTQRISLATYSLANYVKHIIQKAKGIAIETYIRSTVTSIRGKRDRQARAGDGGMAAQRVCKHDVKAWR